MSRIIILDTETTGLSPKQGHRIIEIGCLELINRHPTGNTYHQYINPERTIDEGALAVHGIGHDFLKDKPIFNEIVEKFMHFIEGAELVIHNAPFDVGFINHESKLLTPPLAPVENICKITDSLQLARKKHIGQKNTLDALCKRYAIDNSNRTLHGALLDAQLLAEVYLQLTGGQISMNLAAEEQSKQFDTAVEDLQYISKNRPPVIKANIKELELHYNTLKKIHEKSGATSIWEQIESSEEYSNNT